MKKTLLLLSALFLSAFSTTSLATEPSKASQCASYATNIYIGLKKSGQPNDAWIEEMKGWKAKGATKQEVAIMMVRLSEEVMGPDSDERKRSGWALARPAAQVTVGSLLAAAGTLLPPQPSGVAADRVRSLIGGLSEAEAERPLSELLEK